jgi:arginyl-tRNA synthetase
MTTSSQASSPHNSFTRFPCRCARRHIARKGRACRRGAARLEGGREFSEVSVAGPGFINLKFIDAFLSDCATTQAGDDHLGIVQMPGLDFGGPNVAKPLHVGHLRALVIGESLRLAHV